MAGQVMRAALVGMALWLGLWGGGCSDATDPGADPTATAISFSPASVTQEFTLAQRPDFVVSAPEADVLNVNWWRDGRVVSTGAIYTYVPATIGLDHLRAQVDADGTTASHTWEITVTSAASTLPPAVPRVSVDAGPGPGDVLLTWGSVEGAPYPIVSYAIAASYEGSISESNWDAALLLRNVTNIVGRIGYETNLTVADDQLIPGAEIWLGVRAVDELGQMSPLATNVQAIITTAWWANGIVRDDLNDPVVGVVNSDVPGVTANSDVNGLFRIGPFRSIDKVVLTTATSNAVISGWFDFQSTPLDSVTGHDYEIVLIKRHLMDSACNLYQGQFLNYLRSLSSTLNDVNDPDNPKLWKWESYPLQAYIPDLVNDSGVDFGEAARFAMAMWDSVLGEPYFAETATAEGADLVFTYDGTRPLFSGQIRLLQPTGVDAVLGKVVPEQIEVYLNTAVITTQSVARGIALHELGHALGLLQHTSCSFSDYLMVIGGGAGIFSRPHPVHPNEQSAVRCIRRLPQGVNMSNYFLN